MTELDKELPLAWKGHGWGLPQVALESVTDVTGDFNLVMVSYGPQNSHYFQDDSSYRVQFQQDLDDWGHGRALIEFSDFAELDSLAEKLHQHNWGHLACGQMEWLGYDLVLQAETTPPPLFAEVVRLSAVDSFLDEPKADRILADIKTLEDLGTRYHTEAGGLQTPDTVETMLKAGAQPDGVEYQQVEHNGTDQRSVVARLPGTRVPEEIVILGAHLDSTIADGPKSVAPGADDDASGVATLAEIFRVIGEQDLCFERSIELHFYAAEEVALIGSTEMATSFRDESKTVTAMLQMDMNAYSVDGDDTIYLVATDTSPNLRRSLKDLMNSYEISDWEEKSLTGGTSDFKPWHLQGFPAVFPFENPSNYNQALHTPDDTSERLNNLTLSRNFARLGLAFLAHHAGLCDASNSYTQSLAAHKKQTPNQLFLAISPQQTDGNYYVSVSVPDSIASVDVCPIASAGAISCSRERTLTKSEGTIKDRVIFSTSSPLPLSATDRITVIGYDKGGHLAMQRSVLLEKKAK